MGDNHCPNVTSQLKIPFNFIKTESGNIEKPKYILSPHFELSSYLDIKLIVIRKLENLRDKPRKVTQTQLIYQVLK
ncbi:hypothetical protein EBU94_05785 [bacterium]|nr:hypothetical protein [bacterium]